MRPFACALCAVLVACGGESAHGSKGSGAGDSGAAPDGTGHGDASARDGSADAAPPDGDGSSSDGSGPDCAGAARGVAINTAELDDPDGYAPYAVDGCRLVYVAAADGAFASALVLRDLRTGAEEVLADGALRPRRPAVSGDVIAWEEAGALEAGADAGSATSVVRVRANGATTTVTGAFHHAGEPRVAGDTVVFTGWLYDLDVGDTDVFLYSPATATLEVVAAGFGQQRFADVSPTHIAVSDFSVDPSGAYDPGGQADADIIVIDRATGGRTSRPIDGKQAYPMLGSGGRLAYLEWVGVRPTPKLAGYTIRVVDLDQPTADGAFLAKVGTDPPAIRPTARGDLVEWVEYAGTQSTFYRAPADLSSAPTAVSGLEAFSLFAPQATDGFTVLAARQGTPVATLQALAR